MVLVNDTLVIPEGELSWTFARSGGPGGQNVNKVASKATLRWAMAASELVSPEVKERIRTANPSRVTTEGELLIVSQKYRDQERNREDCVLKLGDVVRAALVVPKVRRPTKPSKSSNRRRLTDKKLNAQRKERRREPGSSE